MPTPPQGPAPVAGEVDEAVWRAVAGVVVKIPRVNSEVYYFPRGHLEQCAEAKNLNVPPTPPCISCKVISVRLLTDHVSDQVYARIRLQPQELRGRRQTGDAIDGADDDDDVVFFAKVLTRSDANNGGGFSVPRFCADAILPPLDFSADPPVQNLRLRDTRENDWEFRHIYRGTPRRHLLTTGWSKYVNAKRLIAGDSVVFMRKKSTSELFIGVRRAETFGGEGRNAVEALAAIEDAVRGKPFEVVYYPKAGVENFVVQAEKVRVAMQAPWKSGMKVKMEVEADDCKKSWIHGTLMEPSATGSLRDSPWRMLKVSWEESAASLPSCSNRVSPWELEYVPLISPIPETDFLPTKKLRFLQDSGMMTHNEIHHLSSPAFSPIHFSHSSMPFLLNHLQFPAGMQGARPDHHHHALASSFSSTTTVTAENDHELQINDQLESNGVSTELSIGNSHSNAVSHNNGDSSVQSGGGGRQPLGSFQLFGMTIQPQEEAAPENGAGGSG